MRRGYVLFAVIAIAAVAGYAQAGLDSAAGNPILKGIQSFIADQRRADAAACREMGKADIDACARDLARQRRAQLAGPAAAPAAPAGTDI